MKNSLSNYSATQIIFGLIHFLSPLFIAVVFINNEDSSKEYSFFTYLFVGCIIVFLIVSILFGDSIKNVKTGRSFKTKSGLKLDEYKEIHQKGMDIPDLHSTILFIHLGYMVLFIIIQVLKSL